MLIRVHHKLPFLRIQGKLQQVAGTPRVLNLASIFHLDIQSASL